MDIESVKAKLNQATLSLNEMLACERKAFGDRAAKFATALSTFLNAGRTVVYRLEKMPGYQSWREAWDAQNPSKDRLLKCIHDKRDKDVHERGPDLIAKPREIKVGVGSSYSDASGKLEAWGSSSALYGEDIGATVSMPDYVFDVCGTERPVTEACAEYLSALEQMVVQFDDDTSR